MGTCNLAQAGFVTRLADSYLDGMLGSRGLTRPFIDACLSKLSEVTPFPPKFFRHVEIFCTDTNDLGWGVAR
jgi:hypothetical protein